MRPWERLIGRYIIAAGVGASVVILLAYGFVQVGP